MKSIGKVELFTVALGSVIGWGAFMLPGNFFLKNAGVINTAIGFIISVIMIAFIEKSYSIMMSKHNDIGGEYTYAKHTFGNKVGFFTGWLLLLAYISIIPLNATAVPMVFEKIFPFYNKGTLLYTIIEFPVYLNDLILSLSFIVFFTIIQLKGVNFSTKMQNITVFLLLASVIYLLFFSIIKLEQVQWDNFESNFGSLNLELVVRIIAFAPWAFIGFDTVAQLTSETKSNPKAASLMALIAVVFGALVYNTLNIITAFGLAAEDINSSGWATGDAVYNLLGGVALFIIGVAMFGAVLSGLNGFFMSSSRLSIAMLKGSNECLMKEKHKKVILFIGFVALIVPFFGRNALFWFVDVSSVGASIAYLVTCAAAYKVCISSKNKIISVLGIFSSLLFLLFLLTPFLNSNIPLISIKILIVWIVIGCFLYVKFGDMSGQRLVG
ncbi:APC family permease [Vibrio chagasii]|uniref:APC family permease n=1 Tax=Vibrio chagasii TaxID=170679 RepID=UPI0035A68CD8